MADYAGAVAAMRARFAAAWNETPIAYQNETPQDADGRAITPWPPVDGSNKPTPWVYFEVLAASAAIRGAGLPANNIWLTSGFIYVHVFTPEGYAYPDSLRLADAAGEVFRAATFYQGGDGAKVVCMAPLTDGGASDADNGNWFRVTCAIPFEFYFTK
jgi:hypothetical protein